MPTRRTLLGTAGSCLVAGLSGCSGLLGDGPVTFEAEQAVVPEGPRSGAGYEEQGIESVVIEDTVEAAGQSQDVTVTNWRAQYDKSIGLPTGGEVRGAVCVVLSTPDAEVLGRSFNPIANMDPGELLRKYQGRIDGIENIRKVGEERATVLGSDTEVGRFEADGRVGDSGFTVEVELLVTEAVQSENDLVLAVCGYPVVLADSERSDGRAMIEGIEHPA